MIKDLELLPLALSAFLALLAVGAVGTPCPSPCTVGGTNWRSCEHSG